VDKAEAKSRWVVLEDTVVDGNENAGQVVEVVDRRMKRLSTQTFRITTRRAMLWQNLSRLIPWLMMRRRSQWTRLRMWTTWIMSKW
jgi:hypothetical protein